MPSVEHKKAATPLHSSRRRAADAVLARSPLQPALWWLARRQLAVLGYHGVDDPECFATHLDYLRHRARPVSIGEVLAAIDGRRSLPSRAVLITFDDGDRSVLEFGVPMLRDRGLPAVAFVVAGALDQTEPHWWTEVEALAAAGGRSSAITGSSVAALVGECKRIPDERRLAVLDELRASATRPAPSVLQLRRRELAEMETAGVAIGNHSLTHPVMTRCSNEKIRTEVAASHRILTDALGHPPAAFAYPNGDCDQRARAAVADSGYRLALLFDHRLSAAVPPDPLRTSRLRVDSSTSLDRFRTILSGLHPALHRARVAARP